MNRGLDPGPGIIRTHSDKWINVLDPQPDDIDIEDIAHALTYHCRFGGHIRRFYSVAEHSIWVCDQLPVEYKLCGLLHDASEAYLMDLPTPVKQLFPEYYNIELRLMQVIALKFGFLWPMPMCVKDIDRKALQHEWDNLVINYTDVIPYREPGIVMGKFISLFNEYAR